MPLVDLDEVKNALKIEEDDYDTTLALLIEAASEAVLNYLKVEDTEYASGAPNAVKVATILLVGYLYENPDADPEKAFVNNYLPGPVVSLLYNLRDPAIA